MERVFSCKCGNKYCFKCLNEDHQPCNCDHVKAWKDKEVNESDNLLWFKANTKPCPKCKSNIEKNQGCNHMTCSKCKHGFCWMCLQDWGSHPSEGGYYKCNTYEKLKGTNEEFKNEERIRSEAKDDLNRYTDHFKWYQNHEKSKQICIKQTEQFK